MLWNFDNSCRSTLYLKQVVHDAMKDGRFNTNPYVVGDEHTRFYAGAPLVASNGYQIGALCDLTALISSSEA